MPRRPPTQTPNLDVEGAARALRAALDESAVATTDPALRLDAIKLRQRIEAGRAELARMFGELHRWRLSRAEFTIHQLRLQKRRQVGGIYHRDPFPLIDHPYWYRDAQGRAAALAFHSYDLHDRPERRADLVQEYASLGLSCTFPDFPAWWYPGAATLVLVAPSAV